MENLKKCMAETKFAALSERVLFLLWAEFSHIQQAEQLIVDKESIERFCQWLETGKDEDAWS